MLPVDAPRVAQAALRSASAPQTRRQSVQRAVAGAGLRAALEVGVPVGGRAVVSTLDDSLEELLGRRAGLESASLSVHFGPPRANQKPVVKVFDERSASARAVAKFGCEPLARRLVANEAEVLRTIGSRRVAGLEIPALLSEGAWGESTFLLQSVISFTGRHRAPSPERRTEAERAVIATGTPALGPLRHQGYHADLADRLPALDGDETGRAVATSGRRLLQSLADERVATGGWHGDWSSQNVCATDHGTGAWDWERWAPDRPCGFDTLHYATQALLARKGGVEPTGAELLALAPSLLAPHQPDLGPSAARRLAALYLVEVGHRYLTDGQRDTPSAAGRMDAWLVPALISTALDAPRRNERQ